jgi:hypothetical protein
MLNLVVNEKEHGLKGLDKYKCFHSLKRIFRIELKEGIFITQNCQACTKTHHTLHPLCMGGYSLS